MNMKNRNKGNRTNTQNQVTTSTPQVQTLPQPRNISKTNKTYAQALNTQDTDGIQQLSEKLTDFLEDFKNLFTQLLNQNSMILSMLTTVINKLSN